MDSKIGTILKQNHITPDNDLSTQIWSVIVQKSTRNRLYKRYLYIGFSVLSLCLIIPSIQMLARDLHASGMYQYASLVFSDSSYVAHNLKEFMFSIVDALPATSLVFSLLTTYALLLGIYRVSKTFQSTLSTN